MSRRKDKLASNSSPKLFRTDPDGDGLPSAALRSDGVAFAELLQNAPAHRYWIETNSRDCSDSAKGITCPRRSTCRYWANRRQSRRMRTPIHNKQRGQAVLHDGMGSAPVAHDRPRLQRSDYQFFPTRYKLRVRQSGGPMAVIERLTAAQLKLRSPPPLITTAA
jgi:hypothetical protein